MVVSCSAVNCVNRSVNRQKNSENETDKEYISFHRFPLNNKKLLQQWVHALRRDKFKPTKYSYVCSSHFTEECYIQSGWSTRRKLREDAVPTLFDFPSHVGLRKSKPRRQNKLSSSKEVNEYEPAPSISAESPQNSICTVTYMAEGPTVPENNVIVVNKTPVTQLDTPRKKQLKRRIKTLQQKLRRRSKTINNMKQLINILKASKNDYKDVAVILEQYFDGFPLHLLLHQLQNNPRKKHALRYSSEMKEFALTLYFYSPKAYRYVRTLFHLPHPSQIRSWVSSGKCEPGFLSEAFEYLKSELIKNPKLKDCTLTFDSMAIRKHIQFDVKAQKYSGYVDCGGIVGGVNVIATEALVFMLVGIGCSFKCPVPYFHSLNRL